LPHTSEEEKNVIVEAGSCRTAYSQARGTKASTKFEMPTDGCFTAPGSTFRFWLSEMAESQKRFRLVFAVEAGLERLLSYCMFMISCEGAVIWTKICRGGCANRLTTGPWHKNLYKAAVALRR
jgi:hypothetical protein